MTVRIGRAAVEISYPFAAMLALILLLDTKEIAAAGLLAALVHEAGHLLWMRICRIEIERLGFTLSGIHIQTKGVDLSGYREEAVLALAGPLMNLVVALFLFSFPRTVFVERLILSNLAILGINILPIRALDGGSALEALLSMCMNRERAEKITFAVSVTCLVPLVFLGVLFVFRSRYNFTLLILSLFLVYNILLYSKERRILGKGVAM